VHTVVGPDHYVPFVMIGKARRWGAQRILWLAFGCGVAHVLGSVLLGLFGIAFGVALRRLEWIESVRGDLASWALIAFGLAYFVWGMRPFLRARTHAHAHAHEDGKVHAHAHTHARGHVHVHGSEGGRVTPWVLFTLFVLGPCEPLIPLLMFPAARASTAGLVLVTAAFAAATVATMLVMTALALAGWNLLPTRALERAAHPAAGAVIFLTGLSLRLFGL
jgi:ABC-type nickel/cobalt efflux system permease component RcnA